MEELADELQRLAAAGRLPLAELTIAPDLLTQLGFSVGEDQVSVPDVERLDADLIRASLSRRAQGWLSDVAVFPVISSTNTWLTEHAGTGSIGGRIATAELQVAGRGRRGRQWLSPFGRNLAVSLGFTTERSPADLGGLSLSVGLAVLDALDAEGVPGAMVKWPNDVLLEGRKLAGILVELIGEASSQIVVGIGVNLDLPARALADIGQPAIDLKSAGVEYSRNRLAAALVSSVVDHVLGFLEHGFAPVRELFDTHHYFHGRGCRVLQGDTEKTGVVRGVTERGELVLDTEVGRITVSAGEVSLRD